METPATYLVFALIIAVPLVVYLIRIKKMEARAREAAEKGKLFSEGPRAQHPRIDISKCIGCGSCVSVCPEGDVLAVFAGKSAIIKGHKCVGHSLCAKACPVGAIEMVMAAPSMGADLPLLTQEYETNIQNLFIAGELGGLALIQNAVNQGRECVDIIAGRLAAGNGKAPVPGVYDVCVVGTGPAGISASLRSIEKGLSYLTLEQDEIGGTVAKYPRQKLVMTCPVQFPIYGRFRKMELSKEELLAFWEKVGKRVDFTVRTREKVEDVRKGEDGLFSVVTSCSDYRARTVILALGRRGTPRKLGIKGEELPKVMYSLIEAEAYLGKKILVLGGGDSAIEAAMGLAHQEGNQVALSYRGESFTRIKERNARHMEECIRQGTVRVLFNSKPVEITETAVVVDIKGETLEIPNDYVWIFAGGVSPNAFLQKIGIDHSARDLTQQAGAEAKSAAQFCRQTALKSSTPSVSPADPA